MQGMRFLIVGEEGPINHGVIAQQITPEKYLCTFARIPQASRVVSLEEIQQWSLFPNENMMNAFIVELQKDKQIPLAPRGQTPPKKAEITKKASKKKVAKKKVAKKKSNGKK